MCLFLDLLVIALQPAGSSGIKEVSKAYFWQAQKPAIYGFSPYTARSLLSLFFLPIICLYTLSIRSSGNHHKRFCNVCEVQDLTWAFLGM